MIEDTSIQTNAIQLIEQYNEMILSAIASDREKIVDGIESVSLSADINHAFEDLVDDFDKICLKVRAYHISRLKLQD